MAEINWGLIDTQSPAKIANALMPSPEQQGAQALQVMQMQHAAGQNQVSQMQIQKMKQDAAGIAEFSRRSALLGGPSDPMEIAQAYLAHPDIEMKKLGLGLMEKAQNIAKYDKMLKDRAAAAAMPRPAAMPFDETNTPQNVAPVTNALPAQVGTAPMSQSALLDQVRAEMADIAAIAGPHGDPRANLRLKSLEKTEAELVKGRVHTPGSVFTMPGVADVVTPAAPSPLARMQAERDALPPNDPRRPALDAAINSAKVTQEQGAERVAQGDKTLLQGAERIDIARKTLANSMANRSLTPEQSDALYGPNGAVTTGKLDPYKINSRNAQILSNAYIRNPGTDMNSLASTAAMMRAPTQVARAQLVEAIPELLQNMSDAGKKVNYSGVKFIGQVEKFAKGQVNDPDFINYMAQRNDLLLTLAGVMRGNGATDKAHQAEIEAASPTLDPIALDAYIKGQMTALGPRLKNAQKITRSATVPTAAPTGAPSLNDIFKQR